MYPTSVGVFNNSLCSQNNAEFLFVTKPVENFFKLFLGVFFRCLRAPAYENFVGMVVTVMTVTIMASACAAVAVIVMMPVLILVIIVMMVTVFVFVVFVVIVMMSVAMPVLIFVVIVMMSVAVPVPVFIVVIVMFMLEMLDSRLKSIFSLYSVKKCLSVKLLNRGRNNNGLGFFSFTSSTAAFSFSGDTTSAWLIITVPACST